MHSMARPQSPTIAEEQTLDRLAGPWRIYQLRRGHRYSTDDLLTAWTAVEAAPRARRVLDLGAGVGSVGLLVLLQLDLGATLEAVEIQQLSAALMRRTVAYNRLQARVRVTELDLRRLCAPAPYDLIVANPPYIPVGRGTPSPHPQRAAARIELSGDVFDYCATAARNLAPGGRFCLCHAAADPRPVAAIRAAGLVLRARRDVFFRAGKPPMLTLYTCGAEPRREPRQLEPLVVRDEHGAWSAPCRAVRRRMQLE